MTKWGRVLQWSYRLFPAGLRRAMLRQVAGLVAAHHLRDRTVTDGPPTVVGLFRASIGLGQGARLLLSGLSQAGQQPSCRDLSGWFPWLQDLPPGDDTAAPPPATGGGTLIVHLNPSEFPLAISLLGRNTLRSRRVVGFWNWELESVPASWHGSFRLVDEIWVPSGFTAAALRRVTSVPVRVVPYPMGDRPGSARTRSGFGIPDDAFVALCVFDSRSCLARKNPQGAIRAFRTAFGDDGNALLILKAGGDRTPPAGYENVKRELSGAGNVRVMTDTLVGEDYRALVGCCDVVLSPHRSEGFGLVPAEGMLAGKPVIATGWSGNVDFQTSETSILLRHDLVPLRDPQGIYDESAGHRWADPDLGQAAEALQALRRDREAARRLGEEARQHAREFFGLERFCQRIAAREGSAS